MFSDTQRVKGPNIGIVNILMHSEVEKRFLENAIRALSPLCTRIYVISGNFDRKYDSSSFGNLVLLNLPKGQIEQKAILPLRLWDNIRSQLDILIYLAKCQSDFSITLFDVGEYRNLVSIIFAKILGKKTVVFHHGGNKLLESKFNYPNGINRVLPPILESMLRLCYNTVDYILCLSDSIVAFGNLQRYRKKILFFRSFIDIEKYKNIPRNFNKKIIGYCGRITAKKGILNFVRGIPLVLEKYPDALFIIAGNGEQKGIIKKEVSNLGIQDKVIMKDWIPDDIFPIFLNNLAVFVLPSYEEGLPETVLEAMAAGCIVVATPVGGIPDILTDGQTGFLIRDNSPAMISEGILRALSASKDTIGNNAKNFVYAKHTISEVKSNWKIILDKINAA